MNRLILNRHSSDRPESTMKWLFFLHLQHEISNPNAVLTILIDGDEFAGSIFDVFKVLQVGV